MRYEERRGVIERIRSEGTVHADDIIRAKSAIIGARLPDFLDFTRTALALM